MSVSASLLARVAAVTTERSRAEAALARQFAPRFNPVALLAPGETRLSEVFRWLLDESETHGQGSLFRDRFVTDLIDEVPTAWEGARVACEVTTADGLGRIDLLMTSGDGTRCMVIENKPWAGWQANQLARYLADQRQQQRDVRVHALIGADDPAGALNRHWKEGTTEPLPETAGASGFGEVAAWLEACAGAVRPENVRRFLYDLADYCRRSILGEPSMTEINDTADLILAGGEEALSAARAIAAALPLAMSREVARQASGSVELVGNHPTVRVTADGIPLHFVLFGVAAPWVGVTDPALAPQLRGRVAWGTPERRWPQWAYIKRVGEQGRELAQAAELGDLPIVAQLIPGVAKALIVAGVSE